MDYGQTATKAKGRKRNQMQKSRDAKVRDARHPRRGAETSLFLRVLAKPNVGATRLLDHQPGESIQKKRTGVKRLLYEFLKLLQQEDRLTQERANRSSMRADIS
jgi:hypothetical protein